ncbi:MAG: hypothetical protein FWF76_05325 [Oscillospiraceae bacterium]|nr:hypothetical protein [Oscillospiraceae bacterium]
MTIFYLVILILSLAGIASEIIVRYVENIKYFGFSGKLFCLPQKFSDTIPLEKFLPENLTILFIALVSTAITGLAFTLLGAMWYISLPCAIIGGFTLCFIVQVHFRKVVALIKRTTLPRGENAGGISGIWSTSFGDGVGKVRLSYKGLEYEVNAGIYNIESGEEPLEISKESKGDTKTPEIYEGDKVITVYEIDGHYLVVKENEIYKNIDTKF